MRQHTGKLEVVILGSFSPQLPNIDLLESNTMCIDFSRSRCSFC